ncbi:lysylphosphatidylglycerol synthase transmembrane domain-containing protein [Saccharicrinis sp. FJH54]|uniref:lysylphosphatidylglycerol synthase transmembrane domain-containing protein n=1 Tax=Saccharicrinis sp. FJH54 TaxID=3344665 RepID=UPI0035D44388
MKKRLLNALKFIVFLGIGAGLLWLYYKDANKEQMLAIIKNEFKIGWIIVSLLLGLISHISRTIRWKLLIEPTGVSPKLKNTFLAVMIGYFANLALPRMGEIARCGVLSKYEKVSFSTLVGTVMFERAIDIVILLIITLIAVISEHNVFIRYIDAHPSVKEAIAGFIYSPWLWVAIAGLILAFIAAHFFLKKSKGYTRIKQILLQIWEGISSIKKMEKRGWFIFHSIFIWFCYYLMNYVCFFAFDFTSSFGPMVGLFVFVMGSYGMVAPVQGGFGPWHALTISALVLFGVKETPAETFALVVHSSMTLMIIIVGFISVIVLPLVNNKKSKEIATA